MNNKPVTRWKPVPQEDPSDRSRTLYIPQIVERNQTRTLAEVVYSAIDRRNFSFRNVLETGDAPVIDEVQGEYDGALVGEFKYTVTNGDGDSEELTLTIPTLIVE